MNLLCEIVLLFFCKAHVNPTPELTQKRPFVFIRRMCYRIRILSIVVRRISFRYVILFAKYPTSDQTEDLPRSAIPSGKESLFSSITSRRIRRSQFEIVTGYSILSGIKSCGSIQNAFAHGHRTRREDRVYKADCCFRILSGSRKLQDHSCFLRLYQAFAHTYPRRSNRRCLRSDVLSVRNTQATVSGQPQPRNSPDGQPLPDHPGAAYRSQSIGLASAEPSSTRINSISLSV